METNIPPQFFPFSFPAGNKCVFEREGPRGSSSNDSINIDIVRQDGSFPPLWKSREVRSHCVSPLFQQTNKVEMCRLHRGEVWAPVALTWCVRGDVKPFPRGTEATWKRLVVENNQISFSSHMILTWMGLDEICFTGNNGNIVLYISHHRLKGKIL